MKQKNKVITDINICATKELFVHFLCTVFGIHFNPFLSEKSFSLVEIKCLGMMPTLLRKHISIGEPFN